jgi:hypothetical protein
MDLPGSRFFPAVGSRTAHCELSAVFSFLHEKFKIESEVFASLSLQAPLILHS